jgi:hypothetical protein
LLSQFLDVTNSNVVLASPAATDSGTNSKSENLCLEEATCLFALRIEPGAIRAAFSAFSALLGLLGQDPKNPAGVLVYMHIPALPDADARMAA